MLSLILYRAFSFGDSHGDADKGHSKNQLDTQPLKDFNTDISGNTAKLGKQVIGFFRTNKQEGIERLS